MPKSNGEDYDYIVISRSIDEYFSTDEYGSGDDEFWSTVHAYIQRGYHCVGGLTIMRERVHQAMEKD